MSKIFLVGMSGPNSLEDLKELIEPIKQYFDGIIWVLHDSRATDEEDYLDSVMNEGKIIHIPFSKRHAFSRNHYLWCGPAQEGSWLCQVDVLERINTTFASQLSNFTVALEAHNINTVFYYNKAFLYQQHESLEFTGSPHEGLRRHDGQMRPLELSQSYPTETDIRYSVRAQKRTDPFGWVMHYAKYYIEYPFGSNHCLLGNCERGNETEIFQKREIMRIDFRNEVKRHGINLTMKDIILYWRNNKLDEPMRKYINGEKILNDLYRYSVLGDKTVVDEHKWVSLKTV